DGQSVRVLARTAGDRRALEGCDVEVVDGDLLDRASIRAAVRGAKRVYHVAADYRLWTPDPRALYRANVDGTRHVLEAACEAGAERIVYTSTVGAVGIPEDGTPGDETTPTSLHDMVGAYKASKFLAERVAQELAARGAPVVTVNPSAPVGHWDVKPTPTGQMVVDFLRGRMVASLDTGLNLVHVRDVARVHILAPDRRSTSRPTTPSSGSPSAPTPRARRSSRAPTRPASGEGDGTRSEPDEAPGVNAGQFVSRLTRRSHSSFFYAFLCLPRRQREA